MRKKYLSALLFGALFVASTATFTSCKDYDDEINDLQGQVDAINVTLGELKKLVESGAVIKSVENITDGNGGIKITLSDGKTYDVLNGTKADVWTIDKDGFWCKNGVKQDYKAVGTNGTNGTNGVDGADGANGKYYVPNTETGCFDIYQDGKLVEATKISWKASEGTVATGVTAIKDGNKLVFANVEGVEGNVEIILGEAIGSLEFVVDVQDKDTKYPTTKDKFYVVKEYLSEESFYDNKEFKPLYDKNFSNVVKVPYRINPSDAYTEGAVAKFISRAVTSRAAGDMFDLLTAVNGLTVKDGEAVVSAKANYLSIAKGIENKNNFTALQLWQGTKYTTSDYIVVKTEDATPVIANSKESKVGALVEFKERDKVINSASKENDAFVKEFAKAVATENVDLEVKHTTGIDLSEYVDLYDETRKTSMTDLNFAEGDIKFEYSKPEEYIAVDAPKTNQQDFINVTKDGKVTIKSEYGIAAVGRMPVVRVDAFMTTNNGEVKLVASSYIKLEIVDGTNQEDITAEVSAPATFNYSTLMADEIDHDFDEVTKMTWEDFNTKVYKATGLTSVEFGEKYQTPEILLVATGKPGVKDLKATGNFANEGFEIKVATVQTSTTTAPVEINVNNEVLTDLSYVDGKYTITITYKPNKGEKRGNVILTQKVTVINDMPAYKYNDAYVTAGATPFATVKGNIVDNTWKLQTKMNEHFEAKQGALDGLAEMSLKWGVEEEKDKLDVTMAPDPLVRESVVTLAEELTMDAYNKPVVVTATYDNGESRTQNYDVRFVNPFKAGNAKALTLIDNPSKTTVAGETAVNVVDIYGEGIYSYDEKLEVLKLTDLATNTYKINANAVSVKYAFTEESQKIADKLEATEGILLVNENTGEISWENKGTALIKEFNLTVEATVTFTDLSVVKVNIPVKLSPKN